LKYIYYRHKCPRSRFACFISAHNGYLECLKFFHEKKFRWGPHVCRTAFENGNYECLIYAIENNCPGSNLYKNNQELSLYMKEKNKKLKLEKGC